MFPKCYHLFPGTLTPSAWRVPAEVALTDIPIRGILTSPAVGVERSLIVLLRDLEAGVPVTNASFAHQDFTNLSKHS